MNRARSVRTMTWECIYCIYLGVYASTEYKRRLPPRGIFWIFEVYIVSTNEKSSLPTMVLVDNCENLETNMVKPLRLGRCIFVNK
jgi:hypothetical protein